MTEAHAHAAHAAPDLPFIHASAGIVELGTRVIVHGKDLHNDCMDFSFIEYLMFCVRGRSFDRRYARVLEQLWIASGYPDARIWCNRISGYLGAARVDPGLAMSAAIAASDSVDYGFHALNLAYAIQREIPEPLAEREAWLDNQLAARRMLHGYGRPHIRHDERIAVALKTLCDAGLRAGPALRRAFWLSKQLTARKQVELNISAAWAAIAIDFEVTEREYAEFMLLMFAPGYVAVYGDQRARAPLAFLPDHQSTTPPGEA